MSADGLVRTVYAFALGWVGQAAWPGWKGLVVTLAVVVAANLAAAVMILRAEQ